MSAQVPGPDQSSAADVATASPPKSKPQSEVIVVTGAFTPVPIEEMDRSVSMIEIDNTRLLFDYWIDYLQTDSSVDLRTRGPNDVQSGNS
jgi:hypothetical protein